MTVVDPFDRIAREHVKLAIQLAEHVTVRLRDANTDPFVLVAVAAILLGGYAHARKTPLDKLLRTVEELVKTFGQPSGSKP